MADDWAALAAVVSGVQARGKAEPGDKTMVDALIPGRDAFAAAIGRNGPRRSVVRPMPPSVLAADPARRPQGTGELPEERSAGHQDPGATLSYLLLRSVADTCRHARQRREAPRWLSTSEPRPGARPARAS